MIGPRAPAPRRQGSRTVKTHPVWVVIRQDVIAEVVWPIGVDSVAVPIYPHRRGANASNS